ncbi:MAG: T9SS type A sorting domain-containing protein, partial [Candidatus Poribacteria bacterium]|nr:T9SS type A sorting domain-containing protein [Candidatus Poribacteria bacterium]
VTTFGHLKRTALYQNFPNPFNPETWLPYRLSKDASVAFHIYNVSGQLVREINLGMQKKGSYLDKRTAAYWDGKDEYGQDVSSGVYIYDFKAGTFRANRKMVILK